MIIDPKAQKQILTCIAKAEKTTSGELRVHLEANCKKAPVDRAIEVFHQLQMQQTKQRNGVLIYLAHQDKKFAIIGDQGIDALVPSNFWDSVRDVMQAYFQKNEITEGLCAGITLAAEKLALYFPWQANDQNELPDQISFG